MPILILKRSSPVTDQRDDGKRLPADQPQREAALDLKRSFIVQAPAGSGKTELLTQRLLKLLGRVDRPERVLAITFTRKATQEMRERILRRLRQARSGSVPAPHEAAAVQLAHAVLDNDQRHGWRLMSQPGRLRIMTIDSLCAQLLQRSPEHGAAVSGLGMLEDARPLYRRAVRHLVEDLDRPDSIPGGVAAHGSLVRVLTHLDGDTVRLEELMVDMLRIRDQWIEVVAGDDDGSGRERLRTLLQARQAAEALAFRTALGSTNVDQALEWATALGGAVDPEHAPTQAAWELSRLEGAGSPENELWRMHWLAQLLTTANGKPRGRTGIGARLFKGTGEDWSETVTCLSECYQGWWSDPSALEAIERMARHPPLESAGAADDLLEDVMTLLRVLLAELLVAMGEEGATDFQHLAQAALQCLEPDSGDAVSSVLMAEDLRLEHLLVDEFQDTSHTQHRLIRRLTEGWQPEDGRSLFLVGDPMQSIYRFRQADVGLFTGVVRSGHMGQVRVDALRLTSNFRSRSELVEWANRQFPTIFPAGDRVDSGAVAYHAADAERRAGGAVEIHPLSPGQSDEDEAREVADLVERLRREAGDPEIAVLVRARSHLTEIVRELNRRHVPFDAVKIDPLANRPAVQDLRSLAGVLAQPADRVAWLALLRAPWCALTVPELHEVAGTAADVDMLARLKEAMESGAVGPQVAGRLGRLYDVMVQALDIQAGETIATRIERAWLALGGPRCYAGPAELENAAALLAVVARLERESPLELMDRVDEAIRDLFAQGQRARLRLMTVHEAKGLEFEVVVLPGLHRIGRRGADRLVLAQPFLPEQRSAASGQAGPDEPGEARMLMAAVPSKRLDGPSVYGYLKRVNEERERFESQRVLYVACTRAREQLHLFGRFRPAGKDGEPSVPSGSFMELLQAVFEPFAAQVPETAAEPGMPGKAPPSMPLLRLRDLPDHLPAPQSAAVAVDSPSLPDREATALGEALHQVFEMLHDFGNSRDGRDWAERLTAREDVLDSLLRSAGGPDRSLPELRERLRNLLRTALDDADALQSVIPQEDGSSFAELPLLSRSGDRVEQRIIDRAWRDREGGWHIVDYKTGQLHGYAGLLTALTGVSPASLTVYLAGSGKRLEFDADGLEAT